MVIWVVEDNIYDQYLFTRRKGLFLEGGAQLNKQSLYKASRSDFMLPFILKQLSILRNVDSVTSLLRCN